jgi:tetratricopeptide (TPR) repeat protein
MRKNLLQLILTIAVACPLWGQASAPQQIVKAFHWNEQGEYDRTIELTTRLAADPTLSAVNRARVWTLLAVAYQEEGRYTEAVAAYEQSLHSSANDPGAQLEYAAALSGYATLLNDTQQTDTAWKMQKRALQVYREANDHGGVAAACKSLANLSLTRRHTHVAQSYLRCAEEQSALAPDLNEDYFAALASTEGWLEEVEHHYGAAATDYEKATALWQKKHGEGDFLVGWGFMLMGKVAFESGHAIEARESMRQGLDIIERTAGRGSIKYLLAEIAFAPVLAATGDHDQARAIKTEAEDGLRRFYHRQCVDCSIGVNALSLK